MPDLIVAVGTRETIDKIRKNLKPHSDLIIFEDLHDFDRWRRPRNETSVFLELEVDLALRQVHNTGKNFPKTVTRALDRLKHSEIVMDLPRLRLDTQERTFYRHWKRTVSEPPKKFLRRVRLLHTLRLIDQRALPVKQAAFRAGYSCPSAFWRDLRAFGL